jgi:hypothetical protein
MSFPLWIKRCFVSNVSLYLFSYLADHYDLYYNFLLTNYVYKWWEGHSQSFYTLCLSQFKCDYFTRCFDSYGVISSGQRYTGLFSALAYSGILPMSWLTYHYFSCLTFHVCLMTGTHPSRGRFYRCAVTSALHEVGALRLLIFPRS